MSLLELLITISPLLALEVDLVAWYSLRRRS